MENNSMQSHKGSSYDTQPAGFEKTLDEVFNKKAPFNLPAELTKWIADNSWWIVLVGAVLSALGILAALNTLNSLNNNFYSLLNTYDVNGSISASKNSLYLSMLVSAVSAVLMFMAYPKLKAHKKSGWNLLYYNFLLGLILSIVSSVLFAGNNLVTSVLTLAVGFVIGAFILFQVRGYFTN